MIPILIILVSMFPIIQAASIYNLHDSHDHVHHVNKRLPSIWHQRDDHPVHALFKRAPGDGTDYAPVGSQTWSSAFPRSSPDPSSYPREWVDALNAAVGAGKIPDIPRSNNTPGTNPVYPPGVNPNSPQVCSASYKCRNPNDTWDAPSGYFALSFDDGPLPATDGLLKFLDSHNETATHFMIGVNILMNPQLFQAAFESDNDIAVHTWTHPYMTTLSNLDLLGQFGWTMELIHNSTGGRVPKFWRPPYGDSDNRVRAIAKEIFGLQTIIWNQDTADWTLTTGATTLDKVHANMERWLTGPKSPGLVILEHESSDQTIQVFIDAYPLIKSNGWNLMSLAEVAGQGDVYRNAVSSSSNVTQAGILAGTNSSTTTSMQTSTTSSASQTSTANSLASSALPSTSSARSHERVPWMITSTLCVVMMAITTLA